jgi:glutamyl-Q tRNA(Asp) synthetase
MTPLHLGQNELRGQGSTRRRAVVRTCAAVQTTLMITRFAPSPTGYLHLGHAFSALTTYRAVKAIGGTFILRLEDIDTSRCRAAFAQAILEDLTWLGLHWETPVWLQSQRIDTYRMAIESLRQRDLIYRCYCTRAEIAAEIAASPSAPHGSDGAIYPGTCKTVRTATADDTRAFAWRLDSAKTASLFPGLTWQTNADVPQPVLPETFGDVVLARKEMPTSYHLSVVLDDAAQNITHVFRGEDLRASTPIHRLLQALFNLPVPTYTHHKLLVGPDGRKYSKRDKSLTLRELRANGTTPQDIIALVGLADANRDIKR